MCITGRKLKWYITPCLDVLTETCLPLTKLGKTDKIIAGGEWKKMKMNPDCWWFMVIMVTLYPLLLWLLVISLLSAYCIFFIWLHSTSDLHSIHFQAAGILQVFIFLLFNLRNIYSWWNVSDNLGKSSKKIVNNFTPLQTHPKCEKKVCLKWL